MASTVYLLINSNEMGVIIVAVYEWKQISENWWGLWHTVKREYVVETTYTGMQAMKKWF